MSEHDLRRRFAVGGTVLLVAVAVAACGSSAGSGGGHSARPTARSASSGSPSSGSPSSGSPSQQITSAFVTFFDGRTDASTKIALLQNGSEFATAIKAQADSGLAKSSSAKVSKVTVSSSDRASVVYSVLLGGQPALKDQPGTAVREQGKWKVSDSTFCALLTLEGQAPAACPQTSTSSAPG